MTSLLLRWGSIVAFSLFVSVSFVFYGMAFQALGSVPAGRGVAQYVGYAIRTLTHPYFMAGMALALAGAATRMALFSYVGIARTAMVSELTLVLSVVFAIIVFNASVTRSDWLGMACIMAGVYLIESGSVA